MENKALHDASVEITAYREASAFLERQLKKLEKQTKNTTNEWKDFTITLDDGFDLEGAQVAVWELDEIRKAADLAVKSFKKPIDEMIAKAMKEGEEEIVAGERGIVVANEWMVSNEAAVG